MMHIRRAIAITAVAATAVTSGVFAVSYATAGTSPVRPASTSTTTPFVPDALAGAAAAEAALVQMCLDGQHDSTARARFDATAATHPDAASQLGADCKPIDVNP